MNYYTSIHLWKINYKSKDTLDLFNLITNIANILYEVYHIQVKKYKYELEYDNLCNSDFLSIINLQKIKNMVEYCIQHNKRLRKIENKNVLLGYIFAIIYQILHINYFEYFEHILLTKKIINNILINNNINIKLSKYSDKILTNNKEKYSQLRRQIMGLQ